MAMELESGSELHTETTLMEAHVKGLGETLLQHSTVVCQQGFLQGCRCQGHLEYVTHDTERNSGTGRVQHSTIHAQTPSRQASG